MKPDTIRKRLEEKYKGDRTSIAYVIINDLINKNNESGIIDYNSKHIIIKPFAKRNKKIKLQTYAYKTCSSISNILNLVGLKNELKDEAKHISLGKLYFKILTKIDYQY